MTADYLLAAGRRDPLFRADPGAACCRKSLRTELQVSRAKSLRPSRDDHNQELTGCSTYQTTREEEPLRAAAKTKMAATAPLSATVGNNDSRREAEQGGAQRSKEGRRGAERNRDEQRVSERSREVRYGIISGRVQDNSSAAGQVLCICCSCRSCVSLPGRPLSLSLPGSGADLPPPHTPEMKVAPSEAGLVSLI